jgi:hypothetical protein
VSTQDDEKISVTINKKKTGKHALKDLKSMKKVLTTMQNNNNYISADDRIQFS